MADYLGAAAAFPEHYFKTPPLANTNFPCAAPNLALDQIVDLYNYWQSLTHVGVFQAAKLETSLLETAALNLQPRGAARDICIATLRLRVEIIDVGLRGHGQSIERLVHYSSTAGDAEGG